MLTWRLAARYERVFGSRCERGARACGEARPAEHGIFALALGGGAFGAAGEGMPPGMLLGAAGVLGVLLVAVVVVLVRALGKAKQAASQQAAAAPAAFAAPASVPSAPNVAIVDAPQQGDEEDVTKLRAFSREMLPNLSLLDGDDEEEAAPIEDSKAEVRLEGDAGTEEVTGQRELILTATSGKTDVGQRRRRNEDAVLVDEALELYVVCDGMGGYAGGDIAANMAVTEVQKALQAGVGEPIEALPPTCPKRGKELVAAVEKANAAVWALGSSKAELTGMGTTIVTARFSKKKQRVYVAHVGDSRLYRIRRGKLQQMTTDHTLGSKGVVGALASNVRRAIGVKPDVKVDVLVDKPQPSDLYLLCTDGMYKMVPEQKLLEIVEEKHKGALWSKLVLDNVAKAIVDAANAAGGRDNISVVLIGVEDPKQQLSA